ncbi:hypothetical protein ACFQ09_22300 [Massilia norwichensis]|uniref:Uncharacterized protein n=1 Tax=Massilia norwichensis TaxID=1442366 RepID=A0ABT2A547_9BURK|nr:hypothetical protein [Massilia norwichensis]MCS0589284.1 hypothetical protein [Massilia norwichensis]
MMSTDQTLDSPSLAPQNAGARRRHGLRPLLSAIRAALQWRLMLWWALLLLLPTLAASLPVWQMLGANLDHSVHAPALANKLDMLAIADLMGSVRERFGPAMSLGGIVALAMTLLLSPLLAGMSIHAARATRRPGFIDLLAGGAQEYARMFRMMVWSAIPLLIVGIVAAVAFKVAGKSAESAILESDADRASHLALIATAVAFVLVHATLDAGRALLANERRRRSAIVAWWGGVRLMLRRPLSLLGVYVIVTGLGLLLAALLAVARLHVPALGGAGTVGAVLLAQLVVLVLGWMRSARLFAMMALVRARPQ